MSVNSAVTDSDGVRLANSKIPSLLGRWLRDYGVADELSTVPAKLSSSGAHTFVVRRGHEERPSRFHFEAIGTSND
jgi:hypothetical protein